MEASLFFFPLHIKSSEESYNPYLIVNRFWLFFISNNITLVQVTIISRLDSCKFTLAPLQMILHNGQRSLAWLTKPFRIWPFALSLSLDSFPTTRTLWSLLCAQASLLLLEHTRWMPTLRIFLYRSCCIKYSSSRTLCGSPTHSCPVFSQKSLSEKDFSDSIIYKSTCLTLYPLTLIFSPFLTEILCFFTYLLIISFPFYISSLRISYLSIRFLGIAWHLEQFLAL